MFGRRKKYDLLPNLWWWWGGACSLEGLIGPFSSLCHKNLSLNKISGYDFAPGQVFLITTIVTEKAESIFGVLL